MALPPRPPKRLRLDHPASPAPPALARRTRPTRRPPTTKTAQATPRTASVSRVLSPLPPHNNCLGRLASFDSLPLALGQLCEPALIDPVALAPRPSRKRKRLSPNENRLAPRPSPPPPGVSPPNPSPPRPSPASSLPRSSSDAHRLEDAAEQGDDYYLSQASRTQLGRLKRDDLLRLVSLSGLVGSEQAEAKTKEMLIHSILDSRKTPSASSSSPSSSSSSGKPHGPRRQHTRTNHPAPGPSSRSPPNQPVVRGECFSATAHLESALSSQEEEDEDRRDRKVTFQSKQKKKKKKGHEMALISTPVAHRTRLHSASSSSTGGIGTITNVSSATSGNGNPNGAQRLTRSQSKLRIEIRLRNGKVLGGNGDDDDDTDEQNEEEGDDEHDDEERDDEQDEEGADDEQSGEEDQEDDDNEDIDDDDGSQDESYVVEEDDEQVDFFVNGTFEDEDNALDDELEGVDEDEESVDLACATSKALLRLKRDNLVKLCEERELEVEGTKKDLVQHLLNWRDTNENDGFSQSSDVHPTSAEEDDDDEEDELATASLAGQAVDSTSRRTPLLLQSQNSNHEEASAIQTPGKKDELGELLDLESLNLQDKEIQPDQLKRLEMIGSGGFKDVYRGLYKRVQVAIADIRGHLTEMDIKELKILRDLRHENIVRFIGVSVPEDARKVPIMIVTEICTNGDLFDYIRKIPSPGLLKIYGIMRDIARGLDYLHSRQPIIIHRDLKSSNVLITAKGVAKLNDFGLARIKNSTRSMVKSLVGTVNWQAPELWVAHPRYNEKVDVYSAGLVFWEMLQWHQPVKRYPFEGQNEHAIYQDVGQRQLRPSTAGMRRNWGDEILDLIEKLWSQNPVDRLDMKQTLIKLDEMILIEKNRMGITVKK